MAYRPGFNQIPPPPDPGPDEVVLWIEPALERAINADEPVFDPDRPINADVDPLPEEPKPDSGPAL